MSDFDTKERLARLQMAFPSNEALAERLGCHTNTIGKLVGGSADISDYPDLSRKIDRQHEQIQKEHAAGIDAVRYALQTIERLQNGNLTDEHLDNVEQLLHQKADDLNAAYA
jgi:hypothetical protein